MFQIRHSSPICRAGQRDFGTIDFLVNNAASRGTRYHSEKERIGRRHRHQPEGRVELFQGRPSSDDANENGAAIVTITSISGVG